MMSTEAILQLQSRASSEAARRHKHPAVIFSEDTALRDMRSAPWLGTFLHDQWEVLTVGDFAPILGIMPAYVRMKVEMKLDDDPLEAVDIFVDKSGFGEDDEPALNVTQVGQVALALASYAKESKQTFGIGIVEEGQFQCWLRMYRRQD